MRGTDPSLSHATPQEIAARYERVYLGSGDHAFVPLALQLRLLGVEVVIVSRREALSSDLRAAADRFLYLETEGSSENRVI